MANADVACGCGDDFAAVCGGGRARGELSEQTGDDHRAGRARRSDRRARPHAGAALHRSLGPAGHRREQARRQQKIAAEYVTKAAPDGYTLFIGPEVTFVVNPSLYAKLPYDPVKGFTPISGLVTINHAL